MLDAPATIALLPSSAATSLVVLCAGRHRAPTPRQRALCNPTFTRRARRRRWFRHRWAPGLHAVDRLGFQTYGSIVTGNACLAAHAMSTRNQPRLPAAAGAFKDLERSDLGSLSGLRLPATAQVVRFRLLLRWAVAAAARVRHLMARVLRWLVRPD